MRLWHQSILPYLDHQRLLSQHREACALRGKGWGKKHATVDYAFTHPMEWLVAYHYLVMDEMRRRGYKPDCSWNNPCYRGKELGESLEFSVDADMVDDQYCYATHKGGVIYPEHNDAYLDECIALLHAKNAECDWEGIAQFLDSKNNK
jgi:uncharacterized protein (TIGR02328 family)